MRGKWGTQQTFALVQYSRAKRRGQRQTASGAPNPKRQRTATVDYCFNVDFCAEYSSMLDVQPLRDASVMVWPRTLKYPGVHALIGLYFPQVIQYACISHICASPIDGHLPQAILQTCPSQACIPHRRASHRRASPKRVSHRRGSPTDGHLMRVSQGPQFPICPSSRQPQTRTPATR